ncbi:MAG: ATP-binding cassette domain-containing protein [Acidimicrobiales bacterium]
MEALGGVDLVVEPGTVYGLLGPNGAGKTTTVRVLTTIITPDSGTAEVLGLDVTKHPQEVRASIGLAGQYAAVDEVLTGRENFELVGQLTHQPKPTIWRGHRAARALRPHPRCGSLAQDVLSGMRRRLDLAASLVHRPPVLFLDEPTTGLDPKSRNDLWDLIRELRPTARRCCSPLQYLEEADVLADRIAVIDCGMVIAEGTAGELKSQLGATVLEVAFRRRRRGRCPGDRGRGGPRRRDRWVARAGARARRRPKPPWRCCGRSTTPVDVSGITVQRSRASTTSSSRSPATAEEGDACPMPTIPIEEATDDHHRRRCLAPAAPTVASTPASGSKLRVGAGRHARPGPAQPPALHAVPQSLVFTFVQPIAVRAAVPASSSAAPSTSPASTT